MTVLQMLIEFPSEVAGKAHVVQFPLSVKSINALAVFDVPFDYTNVVLQRLATYVLQVRQTKGGNLDMS